jgi:signal transduction histidine kinase/Tfp pilus assembly protein PilF
MPSTRRLQELEGELAQASGLRRAELLADMAWTLRRRDLARATELAGEAERLLEGETVEGDRRLEVVRGRCRLVAAARARSAGDFDGCLTLARGVLDSAGAGDDLGLRGTAQALIAGVHHLRGEQQAAQVFLEEALEDLPAVGQGLDAARLLLLNELGRVHFALCDWAEAHDCFARALELARRERDEHLECVLHVNLGNVLSELRELEGALAHYRDALATSRDLEHSESTALALHNLAVVHSRLGDRDEAERCARECLELHPEATWSGPALRTTLLLAEVLRQGGRTDEARRHAETVLEQGRSARRPADVAEALGLLGRIAEDLGDAEGALAFHEQALAELEGVDDPQPELGVKREIARLRCARGEQDAALELAREALARAGDVGATEHLSGLLEILEQAHETRGEHAEALACLRRRRELEVEALRLAAESRHEVLRARHQLDRSRQREQGLESARAELEREVARRTEELSAANRELQEALLGRQRSERDRAILADQLRQAQKMEAVGRLAGGIAHDFNNLLTVLRGHAELLADSLPPESEDGESARQMLEATDRAARLTSQLLAFSRRRPRESLVLGVNDIVGGLELMLRRLIGEDVELRLELEEGAGCLECDPGSLEQVLLNLVVNARDAMPEGGVLTIATERRPFASATEPRSRDHVVIRVSDTGEGIPPELLELIFEPFFTTKAAGDGTGLGLATTYGLVHQAGGTILVDSTPGAGTTFEILLPGVAGVARPAQETTARATTPGSLGALAILLVEDDPAVRRLMRTGLETHGHAVRTARDGLEALEILEPDASAFDVVVADVVMPRLGGPELLRRLLQWRERPPVVLTSGWPDRASEPPGRRGVDFAFLEKPFRLADLDGAIRSLAAPE